MSYKVEIWNFGDDRELSSGRLLRDVEEISKAFCLPKTPPRQLISSGDNRYNVAADTSIPEPRSKVVNQDSLHKDGKSSIWKWKPLKALSHMRRHRFNCCFFLHVHDIEGLPVNFNGLSLCVTWKRKDETLKTRPARVCDGTAEFEETLMRQCTVYGSKSGPHHTAKYEPKLFLLHVSVNGAPVLEIGKHCVDLTRLLPLTLEELEENRRGSGKWTTSFNLAGKARGAVLNVSFGFSILGTNWLESGRYLKGPDIVRESRLSSTAHPADFEMTVGTAKLHRLGSVPRNSNRGSHRQTRSADLTFLDDGFPNGVSGLAESITFLYRKFDEGKMSGLTEFDFVHGHLESLKQKFGSLLDSADGYTGSDFTDYEFNVIEQGVEVSTKEQLEIKEHADISFDDSVIETIDVAELFGGDEITYDENALQDSDFKTNVDRETESKNEMDGEEKENCTLTRETTVQESDSGFYDLLTSRAADLDSLVEISKYYEQENYTGSKFGHKTGQLVRSLSLDDVAESIADDFLNMLSVETNNDDVISDGKLESPRDRLLRQFEENTLAYGNSFLNINMIGDQKDSNHLTLNHFGTMENFDLSLAIQPAQRNDGGAFQSLRNKENAKMLENLETETLMHKWGLNENAFQSSHHNSPGGFGSPVYLPVEEPLRLPSLAEGLGPIIQTKDGGFLRSMNPLLLASARNGARLVIQVSAPIVLPAAMGLDIMEILRFWTSGGVEKMSLQVNELMPLEDITGKMIQALEAESKSDSFNRWTSQHESIDEVKLVGEEAAELKSFPHSYDITDSCSTFEVGESDYVSFRNLVPSALDNIETLLIEGLKIQSSMPVQEAPGSIQIQHDRTSCLFGKIIMDVDELIKYSLSLEEWMKLDAGDFDIGDETNSRILKILAAHHANSVDLSGEQLMKDAESVRLIDGHSGVFGNNFTMCLKLQLRDPFRDYEMVGCSMLSLIELEKVHAPLRPGVQSSVIQYGYSHEQNQNQHLKISGVHLAGLNIESEDRNFWGNKRQQQSGARWLLSSGMCRDNKFPVTNSYAIIKPSFRTMKKALPRDRLWSISSNTHGQTAVWDELTALSIHVRNPDIYFPD